MSISTMPDLHEVSLFQHVKLPDNRFTLTAQQFTAITKALITLAARTVPVTPLYLGVRQLSVMNDLLLTAMNYPQTVHIFGERDTNLPDAPNLHVHTLRAAAPLTDECFVVVNSGMWRVLLLAKQEADEQYSCVLTTSARAVRFAEALLGGSPDVHWQDVAFNYELTASLIWRIATVVKDVPRVAAHYGKFALPLGLAWMLQHRPIHEWADVVQALQSVTRASAIALLKLESAGQQLVPLATLGQRSTTVIQLQSAHPAARAALANQMIQEHADGTATVAFPILDVEQVWGVMVLTVTSDQPLDAGKLGAFSLFNEIASTAILEAPSLHQADPTDDLEKGSLSASAVEGRGSLNREESAGLDAIPSMVSASDPVRINNRPDYTVTGPEEDIHWPELDDFEQAYLTIDGLESNSQTSKTRRDNTSPLSPLDTLTDEIFVNPMGEAVAATTDAADDPWIDAHDDGLPANQPRSPLADDTLHVTESSAAGTSDAMAMLNPLADVPNEILSAWDADWPVATGFDADWPDLSEPNRDLNDLASDILDSSPAPQPHLAAADDPMAADSLERADLLLEQQRELPGVGRPSPEPTVDLAFDWVPTSDTSTAGASTGSSESPAPVDPLQDEIDDLWQQLQSEPRTPEPDERLQDLTIRLQAMEDERTMLEEQVFALQETLNALQAQEEPDNTSEYAELVAAFEDQQQQNAQLEQQLTMLQADYDHLQQRLQQLQEGLRQAQATSQADQMKIAQLEQEILTLERDLDAHQGNVYMVEQLSAQNADLELRIAQLQAELAHAAASHRQGVAQSGSANIAALIEGLSAFFNRMNGRLQQVLRDAPEPSSHAGRVRAQVLNEMQTARSVFHNLSQALALESHAASLDRILGNVLDKLEQPAQEAGITLQMYGTSPQRRHPGKVTWHALYSVVYACLKLANPAQPLRIDYSEAGQSDTIIIDFMIQPERAAHLDAYMLHFREGIPQQSGLAFARTILEHAGGHFVQEIDPAGRVVMTITLLTERGSA